MAFVHTGKNLPADPQYPSDLSELGYEIDDEGEFVSVSSSSSTENAQRSKDGEEKKEHFKYYHTSNPRANDVHKEAMHIAVRDELKKYLESLGVKEIYLTGENGTEITDTKPNGPHLPILTTDLNELKTKDEVVIVIGEHTQDLGIWAWRLLTRGGGLQGGSAIGFIRKLKELDLNSKDNIRPVVPLTGTDKLKQVDDTLRMEIEDIEEEIADRFPFAAALEKEKMDGVWPEAAPGLIMLNPGQLLYSHDLNKTMTFDTWFARPKDHALGEHYEIHDVHNRVPGHKRAEEHLATVFDSIIPQLVKDNTNLYVIAIADAAENLIYHLDAKCLAAEELKTEVKGAASQISAMAFMEPMHDPAKLKSYFFGMDLAIDAKSWIKCTKPKGTFLNCRNGAKPITDPANLIDEDEKAAGVEESTEDLRNLEDENGSEYPVKLDDSLGESGVLVEHADNEMQESVTSELGPAFTKMGFKTPDRAEDAKPAGKAKADSVTNEAADAFKQMSFKTPDNAEDAEPAGNEKSEPVTNAATDDAFKKMSSKTPDAKPKGKLPSPDPEDPEYEHKKHTVSCATFSAGVDLDELIFPNVMDLVLAHFQDVANLERHKARHDGIRKVKVALSQKNWNEWKEGELEAYVLA